MLAGVRQRTLDHGIAPHISVQERPRAAVIEAAAGSRPVQTADVLAPDASQLSAVPLPPDFHQIVAGHEKIVESIESLCDPLI